MAPALRPGYVSHCHPALGCELSVTVDSVTAPLAGIPEASVQYKWKVCLILRQVTDNIHKWEKTVS